MLEPLTRSFTIAALLAFPLIGISHALAQNTAASKDDDLDRLLKKLEDKDKSDKSSAPSEGLKPGESTPTTGSTTPKLDPPARPKERGDVAGKDKDLDSLLEKLGATEDKAAAEEKRPGAGPGEPDQDQPARPADGKKGGEALKGKDKQVDEHLEELTGKRRKKRQREQEESGPLSEVIKQMRDVEQRLSKPDTGEETRKKQGQIVKKIDTLIEQARASSSQSKQKQKGVKPAKPGDQPRDMQDQPGATGGNAPYAKAPKPENRRSLANGKVIWGHLPEALQQEMDNVFKEEALPSREELIKRYYLSVSRKTLTRGR